ncbi:MAG: hypothetical protein RR842_07545 [Gordonibacter sp.]|uniref:DUF6870 family protein n=1 Tax=Gordonibacter sp. TaxID=1968902 RepID=UPI002B3A2403|nr:hypothetical protein [Gordonibacter sp.]
MNKDKLLDIADLDIDLSQPVEERLRSTVEQMNGNPYDFVCCGARVHVSFAGTCTIDEAVAHCLAMKNNGSILECHKESKPLPNVD